jgi:YD repeat-containing protein
MNQYTASAMDARTYDGNGNLAARTGTTPPAGTFAYDYKDRLVEFTETVSGKRHTYTYDALGRLIKKVVDADGTPLETRYFYKGWQAIEERDGTDTGSLLPLMALATLSVPRFARTNRLEIGGGAVNRAVLLSLC